MTEPVVYIEEPFDLNGLRTCGKCGNTGRVYLNTKGGQDTAYCLGPDGTAKRHYTGFNIPRRETGREQRSLSSRPGIPPSQRARILERDNYTCVFCHDPDTHLVIAHIISEREGREHELTDAELYSDENLVASCDECNSGQSDRPISLRFVVAVLRTRLQHQERKARR